MWWNQHMFKFAWRALHAGALHDPQTFMSRIKETGCQSQNGLWCTAFWYYSGTRILKCSKHWRFSFSTTLVSIKAEEPFDISNEHQSFALHFVFVLREQRIRMHNIFRIIHESTLFLLKRFKSSDSLHKLWHGRHGLVYTKRVSLTSQTRPNIFKGKMKR